MASPSAGTSEAEVLRQRRGGVLILKLSNPKKKNALTNEMYLSFVEALRQAESDPTVHAVVITGAGDYFCSGTDVKASLQPIMATPAAAPVGHFMLAVLRFPKLLVAAVNGPAVGVGVTLLPHCDLVCCATSATFWVPFMRIAVVPEFGSSLTFPRILGGAVAGDMLLASRVISAEEALQWGLVSEVHRTEEVLEKALAKVQAILQLPFGSKSLMLYKDMLRSWSRQEVEAVVLSELEELGRRYVSGETKEAVKSTLAAKGAIKGRSKL